ncbi:MAG: hypothetical protein DRP54_04320 [Spirochaetes bacterium]|nr:MAG: hypothetical protein DRP54_04320 [Spirochaetota bacterium]
MQMHGDRRRTLVFIFILLLAILVYRKDAFPQELSISFKKVNIRDSSAISSFNINGKISYGTIDAIRNGITARMYIMFQALYRGPLSMGSRVAGEKTLVFTISYDVWDNSFIVFKKGDSEKYPVQTPSDILALIVDLSNPVIIKIQEKKVDDILSLRAKIKIQTLKLYPPLGLFLFFYDPWNYESGWYYSKIINR